ncbi:MAG: hypothetical protein AB7P02_12720 [Alphaproteobacteria bacterium]
MAIFFDPDRTVAAEARLDELKGELNALRAMTENEWLGALPVYLGAVAEAVVTSTRPNGVSGLPTILSAFTIGASGVLAPVLANLVGNGASLEEAKAVLTETLPQMVEGAGELFAASSEGDADTEAA